MLQYTEMAGGVWYPMGGLYQVVSHLAAIARARQVRFLFNAPGAQITVAASHATGVRLGAAWSLQWGLTEL